jgi:hypothetical protein
MSDILQEAEALIEKHTTSGYIHRDATLLLPGLVEEIKRLQSDNDFLHKFVDDPGSTLEAALNAVREQSEVIRKQQAAFADAIKTAAATLTKWQQIVIKQRALINFIETEERYAYSEHVILSDDEISIATKDLGLQLEQEAGYVERLERLALSLCMEAGWGQEDFEAALEKIRKG